VTTTSPSSAGPTTSWTAVIRSARVMGRCEGLLAPGLPRPTVVITPRPLMVAMSCPRRGPAPRRAPDKPRRGSYWLGGVAGTRPRWRAGGVAGTRPRAGTGRSIAFSGLASMMLCPMLWRTCALFL
jgi:hypothetical protein